MLVFSVIAAVVTAVLKLIPALEDTSFQDIAINLECWILFAVFLIVNCEKWWEASLKTFVFFLVSQPLIYLIQVPFTALGFGLFQYYRHWFIMTVLTLPGAAIAFLLKRRDWISVVVLSVATCLMAYMAAHYFWAVKAHFPHHLLSLIFCIVLILSFNFLFLDRKIQRGVGIAAAAVVFALSLYSLKPVMSAELFLPEGNWSKTVADNSVAEVHEKGHNQYTITAVGERNTIIAFEDESGNREEYYITVTGGGIFVSSLG